MPDDYDVLTLNASGTFVWQTLLAGNSAAQATEPARRSYKITLTQAEHDVSSLITQLLSKRIVLKKTNPKRARSSRASLDLSEYWLSRCRGCANYASNLFATAGSRDRHTTFYLDTARVRVRLPRRPVYMDSFRDAAELRAKVEHDRPDVLIAGFTLIHDAVKLGHALGIPVVGWMNSYEYCPPTIQEVEAWQLTHSHRYPAPDERAFALQHADRLVVNSHLLQARLERTERTHAQVIYPAFDKQTCCLLRARMNLNLFSASADIPTKAQIFFSNWRGIFRVSTLCWQARCMWTIIKNFAGWKM